MIDTIYTIAWIVFIAFFTTMAIISYMVGRRERKELMERDIFWAEYFTEFEKEKRRKLYEKEHNALEAYPNNDTRKIEIEKYKPVCPRGYEDCIWDPARIQYTNPEWYKRLYGDMTPEEAVNAPLGCRDKVNRDPDEKYYCYDDEEK